MLFFFCRTFVSLELNKKINTGICLTIGIIYNRSTDMWGLGCLIWEVFNGSLSQINSLKSVGKVSAWMIKSDVQCDFSYLLEHMIM